MRRTKAGWQSVVAKSLISPMIFVFSVVIALLVIDWLTEENVFTVFIGEALADPTTFSSMIATLIPSAIIAPVMIFSAIFQAPARLPENYVRATFALGSIFCCLVMFALLLKNIFNFHHLRRQQECAGLDSDAVAEICAQYMAIPNAFSSDLRAMAVGVIVCLLIYAVYQAACILLHIEQETNRQMELRRDVL